MLFRSDYIYNVIFPSMIVVLIMSAIYLIYSSCNMRPCEYIALIICFLGAFCIAAGVVFIILFSRSEQEKLVAIMKRA